MNSNHLTLGSKYEEMEWSEHRKNNHKERSTDCNTNGAGISDNLFAFNFLLKNICLSKTFNHRTGSNPHLIK